jgi:hypothetical protein
VDRGAQSAGRLAGSEATTGQRAKRRGQSATDEFAVAKVTICRLDGVSPHRRNREATRLSTKGRLRHAVLSTINFLQWRKTVRAHLTATRSTTNTIAALGGMLPSRVPVSP